MASKEGFDAYLQEHDSHNYERESKTYPDMVEKFAADNGLDWVQAEQHTERLKKLCYALSDTNTSVLWALQKLEEYVEYCRRQSEHAPSLSREELDARLDALFADREAHPEKYAPTPRYACCYARRRYPPQYAWDNLPHLHCCAECGKAMNGTAQNTAAEGYYTLEVNKSSYDSLYQIYCTMAEMGYDVQLVCRCSACVHKTHKPAVEFRFKTQDEKEYTVSYPSIVNCFDVDVDESKQCSIIDYSMALWFLQGKQMPLDFFKSITESDRDRAIATVLGIHSGDGKHDASQKPQNSRRGSK